MLPKKIAFLDVETTGGSFQYNRIIEIGIIVTYQDKIKTIFNSLINPQTTLPQEIEMLTGITIQDLEKAPTFNSIKKDIMKILEGCIIAAHNVRFDYSFLRSEFKRCDITFKSEYICTAKLSKLLFKNFRLHNLDSIISRFNLSCRQRHRALPDVQVLYEFYKKAKKLVGAKKFISAISYQLKKPSLPPNLSQTDLTNLPESYGVYIFLDNKHTPLYIGKSINVKERVLSHFNNSHFNNLDYKIISNTSYIESKKTAGELGALLEESKLIKKLSPLYNRQLKLVNSMTILKKDITGKGYLQLTSDVFDPTDANHIDQFIGFFKSKKQARSYLENIAISHNLCDKLLGLQKTKSACFGYHLGRCFGACIEKEAQIKYNFRLLEAIKSQNLKKWPFNSPIIIDEVDPFANVIEGHIFNNWCYFGTVISQNGDINYQRSDEVIFNIDTYKILASFLKSSKKIRQVRQVSRQLLSRFESDKFMV